MDQVKINGTTLAITDRGRAEAGNPPLLLVHGLLPVIELWTPLIERLGPGRRVVTVALRGFGASATAAAGADIGTHAEDLRALGAALDLGPAIVVGHSTGGLVALELAARAPAAVAGAVLLDVPVVLPAAARAQFAELGQAFATPAFRQVLANFATAAGIIAPTDPPTIAAAFAPVAAAVEQTALTSIFSSFLAFDGAARLAAARCPLLHIEAMMPCDLAAARAAAPGLMTAKVVGSGHFPHAAVPDQVAAMLARFFTIAGLART